MNMFNRCRPQISAAKRISCYRCLFVLFAINRRDCCRT